jgi:hypothetical protein
VARAALVVINLRYWFHKISKLLIVIPIAVGDADAKTPRVVRFDHWGAPKAFGGSNLARSNEPLCAAPACAGGAN